VLGVDTSQPLAISSSLADWQCLVNAGYSFAIIQVFQGGYQHDSAVDAAVANAWQAGMAHVDVYAFTCPYCQGNTPIYNAMANLVSDLANEGVKYGTLWIDVEQCDGCWSDNMTANCLFVMDAVLGVQSTGRVVGIYSSPGEWPMTVGSDCALDYVNGQYIPLWYADYDGQESFDDFGGFGGWNTPAMKQWTDQSPGCLDVDQNFVICARACTS